MSAVLIRVLMIGNTGVGKTSLLLRFHEGTYDPTQRTTIGVDYRAKEIKIDRKQVKLQVWDTAGQERFRAMTSAFYKKAQGIVISFDVANRQSFRDVAQWLRDARAEAPTGCCIILCANKCDQPKELWEVNSDEAAKYAQSEGLSFFETSANKDVNVHAMFEALARLTLEQLKRQGVQNSSHDALLILSAEASPTQLKSGGCCSGSRSK